MPGERQSSAVQAKNNDICHALEVALSLDFFPQTTTRNGGRVANLRTGNSLNKVAKMKTKLLQSVLGIALLGAFGATSAATITDNVSFTATGFTSIGGPVPTDPVTGSFTITFDPTQNYSDPTTAGIVLHSLNIGLDSAISFTYSTSGASAGELIVGGSNDGANSVVLPPSADNDFYLHIPNFSSSPTFQQLGYTTTCATGGGCGYFFTDGNSPAGHGTVTVTPAAVPLPASAWLLLGALAGMGALVRRGKNGGVLGSDRAAMPA